MIRNKPLSAVARPWAAVLVALVLLGSACGGDDNKSKVAADQTATSVTEASTTSTEATTTTTALAATTTSVAAKKVTTTTKKATTTTTPPPTTTTTLPKLSGDITVLAAASLTEAFTEIGKSFEAANPGVHVKFSFDSSSTLATQANNGAPADVYASADEANMKKVTDAGNASDPKIFVRNRLALIVQKNNPSGISKLADVNDTNKVKKFVICALTVPCGNYAKQAMDKAGVTRTPDSYEANVKGVVSKVTSGEADAGIVYLTDVRAASSNADGVDIPDEHNVIANYPIAILKQSKQVEAARVWIDYLLTPQGQAVLAKYGFAPAP